MLDLSHVPVGNKDVQTIYANTFGPVAAVNTVLSWATWVKPRGVSFVNFFCLAGGGGGGGGGALSGGGGGGGGASSTQTIVTFPAWALPDVLYISVGYGGLGGFVNGEPTGTPLTVGTLTIGKPYTIVALGTTTNAQWQAMAGTTSGTYAVGSHFIAATTGAASGTGTVSGAGHPGQSTFISIYPSNTANNLLVSVTPGNGGGSTNTTTAGTLSTAPASGVIASNPLQAMGTFYATAAGGTGIAGQAGTAGGTNGGNGANVTLPTTGLMVTAGTGGGACGAGTNSPGGISGAITGVTGLLTGVAATTFGAGTGAPGPSGSGGIRPVPSLNYFYGGTGGGGAGQGPTPTSAFGGGVGGAGAYGCGGGGGGFTGSTTGVGGRGGDGIVIATAW